MRTDVADVLWLSFPVKQADSANSARNWPWNTFNIDYAYCSFNGGGKRVAVRMP